MKKIIIPVAAFVLGALFIFFAKDAQKTASILDSPEPPKRVWSIKSIDTMKYSRDLTAEKIDEPEFDKVIENQISAIKGLNATHVAVGTPYDERFTRMLKRWVAIARKNNLNVWFRGNFSSWQGWFGFPKDLTREEHINLTRQFINNNSDLFRDGDVFSPCPECENGGPGDPRHNGQIDQHRQFLIDERNAALEEFAKIGKKVMVIDSMNYDVAQLIMDQKTADAMGDIIVIDHYVKSPARFANDIEILAQTTDAKIMLGEFGIPIPDIHGQLSEEEQALWIKGALDIVSKQEELIGLNYWVSHGGSTKIFNDDSSPRQGAEILKTFFSLTNLD